ncbi:MAG TPA: bifunctional demethylmenaquinone methyltransferase/2-methoxy-6-polyprenyl-1,4-benzoquinol methylase UbiE [Candidatus Kryptonia bacterium]
MPPTESFGSPDQKSRYVRRMFNAISKRYDFLNHFLSVGIDIYWRRQALRLSQLKNGEWFLDVACGTGDISIQAANKKPARIVSVDFAEAMLRNFEMKKKNLGLDGSVELIQADAELLPFPESTFDVTAVAFGVRNFGNLERGLSEMRRVLKTGGRIVILEFSTPKSLGIREAYLFYFTRVLPIIGKLVSKDPGAYRYLPGSVSGFPDGGDFEEILRKANFRNISSTSLTFGIATIYYGEK